MKNLATLVLGAVLAAVPHNAEGINLTIGECNRGPRTVCISPISVVEEMGKVRIFKRKEFHQDVYVINVERGDTLNGLVEELNRAAYLSVISKDLAEQNGIRNPNLIYAGTRLTYTIFNPEL